MVFANDVKVDKKFKGTEPPNTSNHTMETWINETLNEAYHLEIPGILTEPAHKNPIYRYGIDRISLTSVGV